MLKTEGRNYKISFTQKGSKRYLKNAFFANFTRHLYHLALSVFDFLKDLAICYN